jgi:acetate---CoA ligase (ADP-forming) subunit beta
MLKKKIEKVLSASRANGWVLEPDAKGILKEKGLPVPAFRLAGSMPEARAKAREIGYPVVAKVVSPLILHKSDVGGVAVNIGSDEEIDAAYTRLAALDGFQGVLVEEMLPRGIELIVGATVDAQFGPVILLGLGGTSAEVYNDTALRLAPLEPGDVLSMIRQLKAHPLLEGYRGAEPVDAKELTRVIVLFSRLVMEMEGWIESIDLNPVVCTGSRCVIADARIMLAK